FVFPLQSTETLPFAVAGTPSSASPAPEFPTRHPFSRACRIRFRSFLQAIHAPSCLQSVLARGTFLAPHLPVLFRTCSAPRGPARLVPLGPTSGASPTSAIRSLARCNYPLPPRSCPALA